MKGFVKQLKNEQQADSYRPEIDGLRALAVAVVIINHFDHSILPNGYLGVDIFFVLSGFVITSSLAGRPSKNVGDFLARLYIRRIKRLVPALVLYVLVASVLICLFNPNPDGTLKIGISSLFGVSNIFLFRSSVDYFAESTALNVFTHTWSLGVEEQFYFVFPLLVWLTGFGRLTSTGARYLFRSVGALSVASLLIFLLNYEFNLPAAYFLMPTRFWELGSGSLLFLWMMPSPRVLSHIQRRVPILLVAGLIVALMFLPAQKAGGLTVLTVILTAVFIAGIRPGTPAYTLFAHPWIVSVGLISYPLYLWHWGVLSLSRWTIGVRWWTVPLQLALMFLLAASSYRFVERPLRRAEWSSVRWKSIVCGLGGSAGAAVLVFALVRIPGLSLYTGRLPSLEAVGIPSLTDTYSPEFTTSSWKGKDCVLSGDSDFRKKIRIEDCTLGNFFTAKRRVLVLGNSFSAAFTHGFDDLVKEAGYAVTITSSFGASPVKEVRKEGPGRKINNYYWDSVVPALVTRLRPGDWVFLINELSSFSPKKRTPETVRSLGQLKTGLSDLSDELSVRGLRLAVLHGNPFAAEAKCQPVSASKQWFTPFGGLCHVPGRQKSLVRRENLDTVLVSLEADRKLTVVDLFDVFCPGKRCTYTAANGQLLYRDENSHPSVEAVRLASPIVRAILTSPPSSD